MSWRYSCFFPVLLLTLGACGFSPVYESPNKAGYSALSHVEVAPVAGRHGQVLRRTLQDILDPASVNGTSAYLLETSVGVEYIPIIIENDGTVSRYRVDIIIPLSLRESATAQAVFTDTVRRSVSYNVSESDYSSYISSTDAVERGIEEAAHDVVQRITAHLKQHETY